jgi:hypothetical protein
MIVLGGGLLELVVVDGGRVGGAEWLVGHRGPEEPDELAGDRDVRDGRAFPVLGEVPVSVMQPDLGLPGALVRRRAARGPSGGVAVAQQGQAAERRTIRTGPSASAGSTGPHRLARGSACRSSRPEPRRSEPEPTRCRLAVWVNGPRVTVPVDRATWQTTDRRRAVSLLASLLTQLVP